MRIRNIFLLLFVTTAAFGQQINPVPDYIFRNQMSVGRNAPTDTAAYLSVGPRFGAVKGFQPPMVVDTNAVTGVKRNGLLIFSVQLNNFAYWDSTTNRFRKITAEAVVDSVLFATRAWRQKGDDSLAAIINTRTDTALLSTRAYRQKGIDSVVTLISTLGGGTVLSVSAGTGMNFTTITTSGAVNADTNVLATRANRDKLKDSLNANIALKVNISDTSTMLGAYLRKADTTAMLTPYVRKGDTTAMLAPYVRIAGFGLTKGTQTLSVDSAVMATRARVQKGIDSLGSLITAPDTLLLSTRAWRQKGDDSVAAIAESKASATGTTNYLSKFTGTSSLGNSIVYATTSEVGISTPSPTHPLDVNGRVRVRTIDSSASPINMLWVNDSGVVKKAPVPSLAVDSVLYSTRAWRQKGDDSVAALPRVTSVAAGTGMSFTTITSTGSVAADTLSLSTRAWRQKAVDSLQANINAKGSGTVTSVGSGFGTNFSTITTTGSVVVDSVVMATRARVQKAVDSLGSVKQNTLTNPVTGTGTTNRVAKFTASGTVGNGSIADSSSSVAMTILANNNIGIGTATPDGRLDINSSTASLVKGLTLTAPFLNGTNNGQSISLRPAGSTQSYSGIDMAFENLFVSFNSYLAFRTGTFASPYTERMRLTPAGRLLVGTTTEGTNTVDIAGNLRTTTGANFATSSGSVGIGTTSPTAGYILDARGRARFVNSSGYVLDLVGAGNGQLVFYTDAAESYLLSDGALKFNTASNTRMTITSAGNVGIGTTSPSEALHVVGRGRFTTIDSTSSPINLLTSDVNGVIRKTAIPASVAGSGTTNYIPKWTNATALGNSVMYEQGGEITIGSTTDYGAFTLQVDGTQYVKTSLSVGTTSMLADADVQIGATSGNDGYLQIAAASNGIAQISFGDGTGNDRFAGYMQYYHSGDSLVIGTASNPRFNLNATGLGLSTAPAERLDVNGRVRVRTIDSSASPINMLWADNDGVIRKAAVPAGGGGVTSVATGFGIDGGTITSTGTLTADTVEMATRARVQKGIDSVAALARVTGSGTTNYVPLWTGSTALGNSSIYEASSEVLIGTTSDAGAFKLQVSGAIYNTGNALLNASSGETWIGGQDYGAYQLSVSNNMYVDGQVVLAGGGTSEVLIGTTSDAGAFKLQVNGVTYSADGLRTGTPSGGTAATWKLGSRVASSVALDATQYIEVDIGGTLYYLATVSFLQPKP